ncbi:MAG TPA: glycine/betaine/sarcosine/D-proline family reductase selenoprotein B [Candidatus Binatia bacterium]|nr:glycine/betaine/sarcosine/D-proline family reductase selenoprotein B [Candidatus Binatia bacterium]
MIKILHYLNQFFAGIGGEEKAGQEFVFLPKAVGPGILLRDLMKNRDIEYATIVCGDNYFHEHEEAVLASLAEVMTQFAPDLFVAGPAFHAGRYGLACAKTASFVRERWGVPALTGLYEENPGTREIGRHVFAIQTGSSAASMQSTIKRCADLAALLLDKETGRLEAFKEEFCLKIPRRFTIQVSAPDSMRAVEMLLAKLCGAAFESEIPQIEVARHPVPGAIQDLSQATLAMVTEGGLVPLGNPDRLESSRGTKYFKYSIKERDDLKPGEFEAMHTGYDTSTVNADPDRLIPVDAMRSLERAGNFGRLHDYYYVTTGTGAMPAKMQELGAAIAEELSASGVNGVVLTAT